MITLGLTKDIPWTRIVRRPSAEHILTYIIEKWREYAELFQARGDPLYERDEPTLTEGLAAFLAKEEEAGRQSLDGDFLAELRHYDLGVDGVPICIGRTDIEWRLYGFPCFTVEFKILDAEKTRVRRYLNQGLIKFVDGRYAARAPEGAMCAFVRPGAEEVVELLRTTITAQAAEYSCHPEDEPVLVPSQLAPALAQFDTAHVRAEPAVSPIHLAHIFVNLPTKAS